MDIQSEARVDDLLGKTLARVSVKDREEIFFFTECGQVYRMYHEQDCCESVSIEDITGDIQDLIGSPLLMAEEVVNESENEWGTKTWTFYKFATIKGYLTIRWYGSSNGYYSESVDFTLIDVPTFRMMKECVRLLRIRKRTNKGRTKKKISKRIARLVRVNEYRNQGGCI